MLQRILVPLDGSPLAERSLAVAARLARATGGTLLLVRVYQLVPTEFTPQLVLRGNSSDEREARAYLALVRARPDLAGIAIELVALSGATARIILDAAIAYRADAIIMTSHGRAGVARWMLGSVAEHVVRHAPIPVLVLRGEGTGWWESWAAEAPPATTIWRACVGLDGSALAERALEPAAYLLRALAGTGAAELQLVRVLQPVPHAADERSAQTPVATAGGEWDQDRAAVEAYLRGTAEEVRSGSLAQYDVQVRWAIMDGADVAETFVTAAEHPERARWRVLSDHTGPDGYEEQTERTGMVRLSGATLRPSAALIALATHGRGGLQRWALGSVAERVLESTTLPLLLVRPGTLASAPTPADLSTASGITSA